MHLFRDSCSCWQVSAHCQRSLINDLRISAKLSVTHLCLIVSTVISGVIRCWAARKLLCGGGMAWAPGEGGGGGGFQKWASVPGPLFCARTVVATKGAGTQILARKFFSLKNFPPHMCSQNDQRDVGIILSHVCWGWTPPPHRHGRYGSPAQTPLLARRPRRGRGGLGKWASVPSPPRKAIFFPPCVGSVGSWCCGLVEYATNISGSSRNTSAKYVQKVVRFPVSTLCLALTA